MSRARSAPAPRPRSAAAGSASSPRAGYSNSWRTRDALQQTSLDPGLAGTPQTSFQTVTTDNRIIVNGLLGLGAEFGEHRIRWTNLYIRDTLKQGRLAAGFNRNVADQDPDLPPSLMEQNTYWFERQLIDTQLVGEFRFGNFSVDLRGTYRQLAARIALRARRSAISISATTIRRPAAPATSTIMSTTSPRPASSPSIAFSDLNEDVYAGGIDLAYRLPIDDADHAFGRLQLLPGPTATASRFQFQYFRPDGALPLDGRAGAARFPALRLQRLHLQHPAARRLGRRGHRGL